MSLPLLLVLFSGVLGLVNGKERYRSYELGTGDVACRFTAGEREYDFCELMSGERKVGHVYETPTTRKNVVYTMKLDGPLVRDEMLPDHEQCPEGTWICMTAHTSTLHESPRFDSAKPIAGGSLGSVVSPTIEINDYTIFSTLSIRLRGGVSDDGTPQQSQFDFLCNSTIKEPSEPAFLGYQDNTHYFIWPTPNACGTYLSDSSDSLSSPSLPKGEASILEEAPPPDSADSDQTQDDPPEGLLPHPIKKSHKRTVAILLTLIGSAILIIGYVIHLPSHHVRTFYQSHIKPIRFRVGQGQLVQWAREDLGVLDYEGGDVYAIDGYGDHDGDLMVNGNGKNGGGTDLDLEWMGMDEQIPLKPSPRTGRGLVASYGSVIRR